MASNDSVARDRELIAEVLEDPEKLELISDLDLYEYLWKYLDKECHGSTIPTNFTYEILSSKIDKPYLIRSFGCTRSTDEKTARYLLQERSELIQHVNTSIVIDWYNSYPNLRELIRSSFDDEQWGQFGDLVDETDYGDVISKIVKLLMRNGNNKAYYSKTYENIKSLVDQLDGTEYKIDYTIFSHSYWEHPWFHRIHALFWNKNLFRKEIIRAYEEDAEDVKNNPYLRGSASMHSLLQVRKLIASAEN